MTIKNVQSSRFLTFFPDHVFRYIDQTGDKRMPVACSERKDDLNVNGYESYFTVNGFRDAPNAQKENCSSLNAFFIDIDGRKDEEELEAIKEKLDPSFILETKNGYHIYWLLDEPIFKEECQDHEWDSHLVRWEQIEQNIVKELDADPVVKDVTRILRVPQTYYWKKTGDAWKSGTEGAFRIKGIYKNVVNTYSMDAVESEFPTKNSDLSINDVASATGEKAVRMAEAERNIFFDRVNEAFPIEDRDSFKALISGKPDSLPTGDGRNNALLVTASLMRQAGWSKDRAINQIDKVGWHGIEAEKGGLQEIVNTINSAFSGGYTYSHKNPLIDHNMTAEENQLIQQAFTGVLKIRKEQDKVRFSNYEREILARNPYLKKNEIGIVFRYYKGVYKIMLDQELSDMILNGLYDDMLWGYRTKKNVSDKLACLLSIIPTLSLSKDGGYLVNVQNGILNIETRELTPHTPEFVSLIQYPVDYDPNATSPVWDNCVNEWMSGPEQEEKTRLIQQFCGYILSSEMLYDRALFMVGDGGNGKSTFIDTIARVIGHDATSHIDLEGLYGSFGMHGLIGKRLNIIEEVAGNYYQANKLKKLVSGEQVTIDIKYKPQFTFRPQAKFVFSVNLLPRVDDVSQGTERRICAITFRNNYRDNPNNELRSSFGLLSKELSGILNWMLDGAKDLSENDGFITTKEQIKMLDDYRAENSSVEGFLTQCVVSDANGKLEVPELYREYKEWSHSEGGRKVKANITFVKEMKAYADRQEGISFKAREYAGSEATFFGISLSPHWVKKQWD